MGKYSDEEARRFLKEIEDIAASDHSLPLIAIIRKAESVLPEGKRYRKRYRSSYRLRGIDDAYQRGLARKPEAAAPPVPPLPEPPAMAAPPPVAQLTLPTEQLVMELVRRFLEQHRTVVDALARPVLPAPAARMNEAAPRFVEPAASPAPPARFPRVAIVGLMRDQFEHVRAKASAVPFDLLYVDHEQNGKRFPSCDYIISSRHVTHTWSEAAIAAVGREHYAFAGGGVTACVKQIFDWHSRLAAANGGAS
jgi:hypothetical protein